MTVIAFKDGVMGSDSLATDYSGQKFYGVDKIFRLKSGGLLGTAGDDDARSLLDLFENVSCEDQMPSKEDLSETRVHFFGLLALPDSTLWYIQVEMVSYEHSDEWNGYIGKIAESIAACGSGGEIALGALEAGATVEEAVKIAIKRNAFCDGDLQIDEIPNWKGQKKKKK